MRIFEEMTRYEKDTCVLAVHIYAVHTALRMFARRVSAKPRQSRNAHAVARIRSQTESPLNDLVQEFNTTIGRERGVIVEVTSVTNSSDIDASLIASAQNLPGAARLPDLFTAYPRMAEKLGEERLMDWQVHIQG